MRGLRLVVCAAAVLLLAAPLSWAGGGGWGWSFNPSDYEAPPGGTIQLYYDITNGFTDALTVDAYAVSFPGHIVDWGPSQPLPLVVPPSTTLSHLALAHFTWATDAPVGYSATLGAELWGAAGSGSRYSISREYTATVTPELPPGALGLLSFVPYGLWRLRRPRA